jgi:hypothetical protein
VRLRKSAWLSLVEKRTVALIFPPLLSEHSDKRLLLVEWWFVFEDGIVLVLFKAHVRLTGRFVIMW